MTEKNFIPKELHVKFTALTAKDVADIEETEAPETIGLSGLSGAPNENIVQNHLNIALLNVF